MPLSKEKSLKNELCGTNGCDKPATKRILFPLGFSAGFCQRCADELILQGIGTEEEKIQYEL